MSHVRAVGRTLVLLLLVLGVTLSGIARAEDRKMGVFEYRLIAFGLDPDSFAAKPRKVWRIGDSHLRYEEARNEETGTQTVAVIAMPDVWLFDAVSGRGKHRVDPGPSYRVRFPVFAGQSGDELADLEIGNEESFFEARNPEALDNVTVAGVECTHARVEVDGRQVSLYRRVADGRPLQVAMEVDGRVLAVRYIRYDADVPADMARFQPPAEVTFEEEQK